MFKIFLKFFSLRNLYNYWIILVIKIYVQIYTKYQLIFAK